jgi:hypothetical protein
MIARVEVERFSLISSRPFDKILAAIKAAIGHPDMVAFAKRTAAAPTFPEFESVVREGLGKTDLMLFMELDHGAVIRKATHSEVGHVSVLTFTGEWQSQIHLLESE